MGVAFLLAAVSLVGCTTRPAPTPAVASSQDCPSLGSSPVAARIAELVRSREALAANEIRAQLQIAARNEQLHRILECFQRRTASTRTSEPLADRLTTERSR